MSELGSPVGHYWQVANRFTHRFISARTGQIVGEVSVDVNESYAAVDGRSLGKYIDKPSAMRAVVAAVEKEQKGGAA